MTANQYRTQLTAWARALSDAQLLTMLERDDRLTEEARDVVRLEGVRRQQERVASMRGVEA